MRGKTSKKYRKLMQQYDLTFGFREPYQVLGALAVDTLFTIIELMANFIVDAQMIQDSDRFKMDLVGGLERTLHGKVKPSMRKRCGIGKAELIIRCALVITQCSIRHLYDLTEIPQAQKEGLISLAKRMERRRCNHHTLEKPLSTLGCLASVIDPKSSNTNKNRYVVASQEDEVRKFCRGVKGVPLVYVKRSVMVMEPMADSSVSVKEGIDRGKFRTGLRGQVNEGRTKRKRVDDFGHGDEQTGISATLGSSGGEEVEKPIKKKRTRGPKGPNPLSVKKPRKGEEISDKQSKAKIDVLKISKGREEHPEQDITETVCVIEGLSDVEQNSSSRKKRKRKHKPPLLQTLGDKDLGLI